MRGNPAALAEWRAFQRPFVAGHKFATPGYWAATKEASAAWKRRHEGTVSASGSAPTRSNPSTDEVATEVLGSTAGTLFGFGILAALLALACNKLAKAPAARGYVPGNPYQQPPGCG